MTKMNLTFKRKLALMLCFVLVFALMPVISLADVDFAVFQVQAVDADGNGIAGAVFGMYNGDVLVYQDTTNMDGMTRFNAAPGEYTLKQISAPAGYAKSNDTYDVIVNNYADQHDYKAYISLGQNMNPREITEAIKFVNQAEEPADVVFSFFVYKEVGMDGDVAPGKQSFTFELSEFGKEPAGLKVEGNTVVTNGVGFYDTTVTITVPRSEYSNLTEGFKVTEKNEYAPGWTYDATEWYVIPSSLDDDGNVSCQFYNLTMGEEPWGEQIGYNGISFANAYTEYLPIEEPTSTPVIPTTGDNSAITLWLGAAAIISAAAISVLVSAKRRCK